jgi:hypothetical protein
MYFLNLIFKFYAEHLIVFLFTKYAFLILDLLIWKQVFFVLRIIFFVILEVIVYLAMTSLCQILCKRLYIQPFSSSFPENKNKNTYNNDFQVEWEVK